MQRTILDNNTSLHIKGKILYSIMIGLLPLLSIYRDPLGIAEIGTILLIICIPIIIFFRLTEKIKLSHSIVNVVLILFLLDAGWTITFGNYNNSSFKTAYLTWIIMLICLIPHLIFGINILFDRIIAYKTVQFVTIINSIVIILQYFMHIFLHSYLCVIIIKNLVPDAQKYGSYLYTGTTGGVFRPAGFFLEPSHFSLYALVALLYLFVSEDQSQKRMINLLLVSVAIVLTTSSIGLFFVSIFWLFSIYYNNRNRITYSVLLKWIVLPFLIVVFGMIFSQFDFVQFTINRVFTGNIETSAVYTRIYNMQLLSKISNSSIWFGNGFMNFPGSYVSYNNGFVKLYYGQGIVGVLLMFSLIFICFMKTQIKGKILALCYFSLFFVSQMYSTIYLVYYLIFIFSELNVNTINKFEESVNNNKFEIITHEVR